MRSPGTMPMPAAIASAGCAQSAAAAPSLDRGRPGRAEQAADHALGTAAEQARDADDFPRAQAQGVGPIGLRRHQHVARRHRRGGDLRGRTPGHGRNEIADREGAAPAHRHHPSVAQHRATIGDRHHLVEAMGDVDDGGPLPLHACEHREQPLDLALLERGGRLVEDEDTALAPQCLGDRDQLTLGEAERGNRPLRIAIEVELGEHGARLLLHAGAVDHGERAEPPYRKSPSAMFSATDSAGTSRSSCGMVTIPAAIASCGLANRQARPATKISP